MADYRRFVSYIYAYPGGVKDKNVGFAKVEVRSGEMHLNINLRGVYTDTPQLFGVHMLIDRDTVVPGRYRLMKVGDCMVNNGMAAYSGIFNAGNIDNTGYSSSDICGIAIANQGDRYYMMFSMWEDYEVNPDVVEFAGKNIRKYKNTYELENKATKNENIMTGYDKKTHGRNETEENENIVSRNTDKTQIDAESKKAYKSEMNSESENDYNIDTINHNNDAGNVDNNIKENAGENICGNIKNNAYDDDKDIKNDRTEKKEKTAENTEQLRAMESESCNKTPVCAASRTDVHSNDDRLYKKLYSKADYIDAFDDDYFYDCIEVTPQMLSRLPIKDKEMVNNSFLIHGYYNFHHLLFGRVCDNENNTNYFIGVPGMYCNRERYMASMFGFSNFKKSHRSDYNNPYFGYWYQEI